MRGIPSAENLTADVEGDISDVDGVLRITSIRVKYRVTIPADSRDKVERILPVYAEKCPAYQSVKDSIDCTWEAELVEA